MKVRLFYLLLLFQVAIGNCQKLSGIVLDAITLDPIESASVYYDNTTIGTATDINGEFDIEHNNNLSSDLVISFIGYETIKITDHSSGKFYKILLNKRSNILDEVVINAFDGMPKKIKLKHFRAHFLGETRNGKSCKILNEDDLNLSYNKRKKQLVVTSEVPILVRNDNLEYDISFDLKAFTIDYSYVDLEKKIFRANSVVYKGTSFYTSTSDDKSVLKRRKRTYQGSILHFMRALANQKLSEQRYLITSKGFVIKPTDYIQVREAETSDIKTVKMRLPLSIIYKKSKRSSMRLPNNRGQFDRNAHNTIIRQHDSIIAIRKRERPGRSKLEAEDVSNKYFYNLSFIIDKYGNYAPLEAFYFTGYLSELRVGDSLPLDYNYDETK